MYRLLRNIAFVVVLLVCGYRLSAQELIVGAEFSTLFDNREYAGMEYDESGTLFSARLTPKIGIEWSKYNRLVVGVDMFQDFGNDAEFLSDSNLELYYAFDKHNVKLRAGIFPRYDMRGLQSPLFFDRSYRYYNNCMSGVLARYEWGGDNHNHDSYIELAMDYTGMRSFDTREAFMIMSSARYAPTLSSEVVAPYCGYDFLMGHYAKDFNPATDDGVVDNLLLLPHIGSTFIIATSNTHRPVSIDLRLGYLLSLQRDRHRENRWESPMGGEIYFEAAWYGISLSNRLYLGSGSPMHLYNRYGSELYYGTQHYAATKGIYNATTAAYTRSFFDDSLSLSAGITAEYDGTAWGTRQWLEVGVTLDYGFKIGGKRREKN